MLRRLAIPAIACTALLLGCNDAALHAPEGKLVPRTEAVEFGEVVLQASAQRVLHLDNVGGTPIFLEGVEVVGAPDIHAVVQTPEIPGGASGQIGLRFRPQSPGPQHGHLRIVAGASAWEISVSGAGLRRQVDTFIQGQSAVDVLFAIDNTGSMEDDQPRIETSLTQFMGWLLDETPADFHVGVVTAAKPTLHGEPPFVTRDTPDVLEAFLDNADVGTHGPEPEMGLEMAYQAVTEGNPGFRRPLAPLVVILLSDEDDQGWQTPEELASGFAADVGAFPEEVRFHLAAGGDCFEGDAARTLEFASLVDATVFDPCVEDYSANLKFPLTEQHQGSAFPLTYVPRIETLSVQVDGAGSEAWHYDGNLNAVVFEPAATPADGTQVRIAYDAAE
jgi:hypothetical protein